MRAGPLARLRRYLRSGGPREDRPPAVGGWATRPSLRVGYAVASLILIGIFPLLSGAAADAVFIAVSFGTLAALFVGLASVEVADRRPWLLLVVAVGIVNVANIVGLFPGRGMQTGGQLLNAAGNALALARWPESSWSPRARRRRCGG